MQHLDAFVLTYRGKLLQNVIDVPDDSPAELLQQCVYDSWGGSSDLPQLVDQMEC